MNVAVIPARGGSKRIPKKNIKNFCGKPMISYSIEKAKRCSIFERVIVSTDDYEIADIAEDYGAEVPFMRSEENAGDFAGTADVLIEVIDKLYERGIKTDYLCCIYPTAPLLDLDTVKKAFHKIRREDLDTVFPVVEYEYPVQRAIKITDDNRAEMIRKEYYHSRTQDLQSIFHDAGQFYFIDVNKFYRSKKLFTKNSGAVIVNRLEVQDIDDETDWKMAELKYHLKYG